MTPTTTQAPRTEGLERRSGELQDFARRHKSGPVIQPMKETEPVEATGAVRPDRMASRIRTGGRRGWTVC